MKKFILLLVLGMISLSLGIPGRGNNLSSDQVQLFNEASEFYQKGQYAEAAQRYNQLIASGLKQGTVYYNLGNAYFKQGQLGLAIANYLRAERLDPRDPDIQANLRYARSLQTDRELAETKRTFTGQLFLGTRDLLTLRELFILALIFFWGSCLFWAGKIWKPGISLFRTLLWSSLVLYFLFGGLLLSKYHDLQQPKAVTISPEVSVMSGPDTGTVLFTLGEGSLATIQVNHQDWVRISLPNGLTGWVERINLEIL